MKLRCQIAGKPISTGKHLAVKNPFNGQAVGAVTLAGREHVDAAIAAAVGFRSTPSRWQRFTVLDQARQLLAERREEFARLITSESGLCIRETRYEVGRATDVLRFAAMEALRDDGEIFSWDISPQGKASKRITLRAFTAEGAYQAPRQPGTASQALLVQESVARWRTRPVVEQTGAVSALDPLADKPRRGAVIDEEAAIRLERVVKEAVAAGAKVLVD